MKKIQKLTLALMMGASLTGIADPSFASSGEKIYINGSTVEETSNLTDGYLFNKVENMYLVSGEDFADALTGGVLAGEKNGSIFYVNEKSIDERGYKRIKQAKNVYAVGGDAAIPENLVKGLSNYRGRIFGSNRYGTATEVAKVLGEKRNILIASGENFPDALSASALAIEKDMNIILTGKDVIPGAVKNYLMKNKEKEVYFVGGDAAVSNKTKEEIFSMMGKNSNELSERIIAGKNRYETSKAAAIAFGPSKSAILANGGDYKDALLGSSVSAQKQAPIFLVSGTSQLGDLKTVLENRSVKDLYTLSTGNNFKLSSLAEVASHLSGSEAKITNTVGKVLSTAKTETPLLGNSSAEVKTGNTYSNAKGESFAYKKAFDVSATAYIATGNRTASGTWPKRGTISVDRRVIPMGTLMYVEGYGFGRAEDTGGAIKGNKIDVFVDSYKEARNWGRRTVKVYIIE